MNFDQKILTVVLSGILVLSSFVFTKIIEKYKTDSGPVEIIYADADTKAKQIDLSKSNDELQDDINPKTKNDLIDINTADKTTLMNLPGIGEYLAKTIVDYRNKNGSFSGKEDFLKVPGIGLKRYQKIEPYIKPLANLQSADNNILSVNNPRKLSLKKCPNCGNVIYKDNSKYPHRKPYCHNCLYYLNKKTENK